MKYYKFFYQFAINTLKHQAASFVGDKNVELVEEVLEKSDSNSSIRALGDWLSGPQGEQNLKEAIQIAGDLFEKSNADPYLKQLLSPSQLPLDNSTELLNSLSEFKNATTEEDLTNVLLVLLKRDAKSLDNQTIREGVNIFLQCLKASLIVMNNPSAPRIVGITVLEMEEQLRELKDLVVSVSDFIRSPRPSRWHMSEGFKASLLEQYLERVVIDTKYLPWGYLPASVPADLEIGDVYTTPLFKSLTKPTLHISDEWAEKKLEKETNERDAKTPKGGILDYEMVNLGRLLETHAPIAIVGYMGTGKSMAMNYIAWAMAKGEPEEHLGILARKIPLLIRLGHHQIKRTGSFLESIISAHIRAFTTKERVFLRKILLEEWEGGRLLIILDALDEFPSEHLAWISEELIQLTGTIPADNKILLTSRPNTFSSTRIPGFATYQLQELTPELIGAYIDIWVRTLCKSPEFASINPTKHAGTLSNQILKNSRIQEIVSTPLFLTILILLSLAWKKNGVTKKLKEIKTESHLIFEYIHRVIQWEKKKGRAQAKKYGDLVLEFAFAYFAYYVEQARLANQELSRIELLRLLADSKKIKERIKTSSAVEDCLNFWIETGLIEEDKSTTSLKFRHQAFQLFGTALAITFQSKEDQRTIIEQEVGELEWSDVRKFYFGIIGMNPTHILG